MKKNLFPPTKQLVGALLGLVAVMPSSARAANATWSSTPADGNWIPSGTNWGSGSGLYPGSTSATTNTDVATFLSSSGTAITINSPSLNLGSILFGSASVAPSSYTIGTVGGNALNLSSSGTIQFVGSSSAANVTQTIAAPVVLQPVSSTGAGTYTFINSHATTSNTLVFNGGISAGTTTQGVTLNLLAPAGSLNTINGVISNGGATQGLSIYKSNPGNWALTNTNTYTGTTLIERGSINLTGIGSAASSAFTVGTIGNPAGGNTGLTIAPAAAGTVVRGASLTYNGVAASSSRNLTLTGIAAATTDQFTGALTMNSGGIYGQLNSNASGVATLSFGSLVRNQGTVMNLVNSTSSGVFGTGTGANAVKVTFGSAPAMIGGGSAGTTSAPILPFATLNSAGGGGAGLSFATYDSDGLRELNIATEMAVLGSGSNFTAGQNARVTTSGTLVGNVTVNSLFSGDSLGGPNATLSLGGNTLTVTSGAIASDSGNQGLAGNSGFTIGSVQNDGVLDFGSSEGFLHVNSQRLLTVNSVIAGSGGLTVGLNWIASAPGLVLNGANIFTGTTRFTGNTLGSLYVRLTNGLALQNSTLDYNSYGASFTFGVNGLNNVANTNVTTAFFGGLSGNQAIALNNSGPAGGGVTLNVGGNHESTTYSGVLSGTGSLVKNGNGKLSLSGANSYLGSTTVSAGTLQFTRPAALYNSGTASWTPSKITVANGATLALNYGGAADFTSAQVTQLLNNMAASTGSTGLLNGAILGFDTTVASGSFSGVIANTNSGANVIGLTKLGTNTLTLHGANTYTGSTRIENGTLAVGAAGSISDTIILGKAGATTGILDVTSKAAYSLANLSGNGTVNIGDGKVLTAAGNVAPGFSAGTLNVTGGFTLAGLLELEIAGNGGVAGTDFDFLNVSQTFTYGGTLAITAYSGYDLAQEGSYNLIDAGSFSGNLSEVTVGGNVLELSGNVWSGTFDSTAYSFDQTTGILEVAVVPEPGTWIMILSGIGMLALRRSRRS